MKFISIILFYLFISTAQAQTLVVHGFSYHSHGNFNKETFGLGYQFNNNLIVGVYENSNNVTSYYLGYNFKINEYFSVPVALATGYSDMSPKIMILPTLSIPIIGNLSLGIGMVPTYYTSLNRIGFIAHTTLQYKF